MFLRHVLAVLFSVAMLEAGWQVCCEKLDLANYPAPGRFYVVDGVTLHLRCVGAGSPTIVLISGSGASSVLSYELQDRMSQRARVCTYDRPGLGWSSPSHGHACITDSADQLISLLAVANEAGPFLLVPESFGGLIALSMAKRRPDLVAGLVMVDSSEPQLWFHAMPELVGPTFRNNILMQIGWRLGVVRIGLKYGQPDWIENMSERNQQCFSAIYSRPIPSYAEGAAAFLQSSPFDFRAFGAGALADLPMLVITHGEDHGELSEAFESGWAEAKGVSPRTRPHPS
ncbi:MAG: alpha/beta hydrolase [Parvularculaceae bacterium]